MRKTSLANEAHHVASIFRNESDADNLMAMLKLSGASARDIRKAQAMIDAAKAINHPATQRR